MESGYCNENTLQFFSFEVYSKKDKLNVNVKDMAKVQAGIKFKRMNCATFASNAIRNANRNLIASYLRMTQLIANSNI